MPQAKRPSAALTKETRAHLDRIEQLLTLARAADQAEAGNPAEWTRALLRALSDMREESKAAERSLSDYAHEHELLSPTEISKAAKITRAALYKRRPTSAK